MQFCDFELHICLHLFPQSFLMDGRMICHWIIKTITYQTIIMYKSNANSLLKQIFGKI